MIKIGKSVVPLPRLAPDVKECLEELALANGAEFIHAFDWSAIEKHFAPLCRDDVLRMALSMPQKPKEKKR